MKKTIAILTLALIVMSCQPRTEVQVIDGCQYLVTTSYVSGGGFVENKCHKGNCNNPIHNNITVMPKEQDSIIILDTAMIRKLSAMEWHLKMDTACSMSDKQIKRSNGH